MSKTVGVCEDCGEVELTGWPPGMSIFALGTDYPSGGLWFYCDCGKKAYLKGENDHESNLTELNRHGNLLHLYAIARKWLDGNPPTDEPTKREVRRILVLLDRLTSVRS